MSDLSGNNHRLICPICKKDFLNKAFSDHLLYVHKEQIFTTKNNKKTLEEYTNKKVIYSGDFIEVEIDGKNQFFVPCCSKFYTKTGTAINHLKNKECKSKALVNAKGLLDSIVSTIIVNTPITIDISGNNNNNNTISPNITNNITISIDETLLEKLLRSIIIEKDVECEEKARYYKKYQKMKQYLKDVYDDDCDSQVSEVKGYYSDKEIDSDTDTEKMKKYYDINKRQVGLMSRLKKDYSRQKLNLSTREKELEQQREQEEEEERQKKEDREQEERERSEKIGDLRDGIKSIKEQIKRFTKRHNDFLDIMKNENSGITQEIFDSEYSQTTIINKLNKQLEEAQSMLTRLLR